MRHVRSATCVGLAIALAMPVPANAQSIGQWGMWGDRGAERRQSKKQNPSVNPSNSPLWFFDQPAKRQPAPALRTANGGPRPSITPRAPTIVAFGGTPGEIVIDTRTRKLFFAIDDKTAYAYPISVGRDGFKWAGTETISRAATWPDWHPPHEMRKRDPSLPIKMTGGIRNPLGAVALYLGDTLYRIHGTNDRKSIGRASSSGCFRMLNEHAAHLAALAVPGTVVKVLPHLPADMLATDKNAAGHDAALPEPKNESRPDAPPA